MMYKYNRITQLALLFIILLSCKSKNRTLISSYKKGYKCQLVAINNNNVINSRSFTHPSFDLAYYTEFIKYVDDGIFISISREGNSHLNYFILKEYGNTYKLTKNKENIAWLKGKEIAQVQSLFNNIKVKNEYYYVCQNPENHAVFYFILIKKKGEVYVKFTSYNNSIFNSNDEDLQDYQELKPVFELIDLCKKHYYQNPFLNN